MLYPRRISPMYLRWAGAVQRLPFGAAFGQFRTAVPLDFADAPTRHHRGCNNRALGVLVFDTLPGMFIGIAVSARRLVCRASHPAQRLPRS